MTHKEYLALSPQDRRAYRFQVIIHIHPGRRGHDYRFATKAEALAFAEVYGPHRAKLFDYTIDIFGVEFFLDA